MALPPSSLPMVTSLERSTTSTANLSLHSKEEARLYFKKLRSSLPASRREEARKNLFQTLPSFLSSYFHVLSFMPIGSEIDITPLNNLLAKEGRLLLPKVSGETLEVFGVDNRPLPLEKISLVLVPALAFDKEKNRLGYGRGYYDRFLRSLPHTPSYGVGFREQLVSKLPVEVHDYPLTSLALF